MLKRWAAWPPGIRWLAGIAAVVLAAAVVWALFVPLADWLARHDVGSAKPALLQTARDAARGRLLTLAAGLFAAGALVYTALNFNLSREGQVTDRYTKAIEQLGSDKLDVRIGSIYALERVARDSPKDHPTVMEVLTAFIREHSREQWPLPEPDSAEPKRSTRPDVQAAVTVIGRRDPKRDVHHIGLGGADLPGADLAEADLAGADLTNADLADANLLGAKLIRANLTGANLTGAFPMFADLAQASMSDANLTQARMWGANLTSADLSGAILNDANLRGANFTGAFLAGAKLIRANLDGANLTRANLDGTLPLQGQLTRMLEGHRDPGSATLAGADLTDADLTGVMWPGGVPVPEGWTVDSESGRLQRAGQLSEVTAHYP